MRAGGWKWSFNHDTSLMGNGRQNHKFSSQKKSRRYDCAGADAMEIHVGGNQGGMRNN